MIPSHFLWLLSSSLPTSFDRPSLGSERSERERMRDGPSHSSFIHCTVPSLRSVSPSVRPVATLGCRWWSEGRSTEPQPIPSGETRSGHMARYGLSLGVNLLGHNGNSQDGRMKVLIWCGVGRVPGAGWGQIRTFILPTVTKDYRSGKNLLSLLYMTTVIITILYMTGLLSCYHYIS